MTEHSERIVKKKLGMLATIGYEGRTLDAYLSALVGAGVDVLYDVRRNAVSRKPGFSKKTLARECERMGVRYEHVPQLGIASEKRRALDTQADYDALFDEYERESLPRETAAVARIAEGLVRGERVALTCFEALPQRCHRHCVAEAVERQLGSGIVARNL